MSNDFQMFTRVLFKLSVELTPSLLFIDFPVLYLAVTMPSFDLKYILFGLKNITKLLNLILDWETDCPFIRPFPYIRISWVMNIKNIYSTFHFVLLILVCVCNVQVTVWRRPYLWRCVAVFRPPSGSPIHSSRSLSRSEWYLKFYVHMLYLHHTAINVIISMSGFMKSSYICLRITGNIRFL